MLRLILFSVTIRFTCLFLVVDLHIMLGDYEIEPKVVGAHFCHALRWLINRHTLSTQKGL